jgi:hypothetical protein
MREHRDWLLGVNLAMTVLVIVFLIAWDAFGWVENIQPSHVVAISGGVRAAVVLIVTLGVVGLVQEVRFRGRVARSLDFRAAAHLVAPCLLAFFLILDHARASRPVTYVPPRGATYDYHEVRVRLPGGDVLGGSLTLPRGREAGAPAVVLITGSSPHDRDNASPGAPVTAYRPFRQIAHHLSSNGIAVLRMDDRGVGQSVGGDIRQLTTPERAKDIEACIAWLRHRPEIDASRIGLVGLSEGVSISHLIASQDRRIKALVFLSGIGSPGKDVLRYQVEQGVLSEQALSVLVKEDRNTRFLHEFDPLITARMITQPVLIVHGDRDRYVPYRDAFRLERAIRGNGNENVTTRILAGYDHTLLKENPEGHIVSTRVPDEVLVLVRGWLAREL